MEIWREAYAPAILDALEAKIKLESISSLLASDPITFCEECEAMKCYGSLYPICEPVLEKLKKIIGS
ncbi:MAG: hypothetical protein JSV18_04060 [Candidatus Bathyarchaeota archaeon]|nr:MAG: hypothetical protein JSV18_04060 [Candidatus Bathyarchaeota archaeon]